MFKKRTKKSSGLSSGSQVRAYTFHDVGNKKFVAVSIIIVDNI